MANTTINIPEGMELVRVDDTHYEIKKKEDKPYTWDEYKKMNIGYYSNFPCIDRIYSPLMAFTKLLCLYKSWTKDIKFDYHEQTKQHKWYITVECDTLCIYHTFCNQHCFIFLSEDEAINFLNTFRDLFETAKELL